MAVVVRYYRVSVCEDGATTPAYFFENDKGQFDLRFGFGLNTSHMHSSLEQAVQDFYSHLVAANPDVSVSVGEPVEVEESEVLWYRDNVIRKE